MPPQSGPHSARSYMPSTAQSHSCRSRTCAWRTCRAHSGCARPATPRTWVSCINTRLPHSRSLGVRLPVLVDLQVANAHVLDPVLVPLVEFGGLDASYGGSESPMGSWAIGADEHSEVEGSPWNKDGKYRLGCGCRSQHNACSILYQV